jgi:hypothetical protein
MNQNYFILYFNISLGFVKEEQYVMNESSRKYMEMRKKRYPTKEKQLKEVK